MGARYRDREGHEGSSRERRRRRDRELSDEERALRDAQRRVRAKLGFLFHLIPYLSVCAFLLVVAGFRAFFAVAVFWGMGVFAHYFAAVIGPDLRRRMVDREVGREHARSLEQLSASIAHEIRNPLTAAKSLVQQMGEDPASPDSVGYAKVALEELDRVERSIAHLLRYAREEEVEMQDVSMAEVIDSALETFRDRSQRTGVRVEREVDSQGRMRGDPEKLRRVVINLVSNAFDAVEQAQCADPRVRVSSGENLARTEVWVRVRDNGPGIDAEARGRLFNPFYTSKEKGTGLGLAISKKLVDAHAGSIEVDSVPTGGTEFVLTFPKRRYGPAD
jgi:signal transduction histidine kinase